MNEALALKLVRTGLRTAGRVAPNRTARVARKLFFTPQQHPRPAREVALLESATPLKLDCGLAAWSWGTTSAPTVLLVHGWAGRGAQLGAFVKPLLEKGFRVIAVDGPAHGESPGTQTNPVHFAQGLLAAAAEIGPLHAIIAHSFGAAASTIAIMQGLQTNKLVYAGGPATYAEVLNRVGRGLFDLPPKAFEQFVKLVEKRVGLSVDEMDVTQIAEQMDIPALIIHALNDVEIPYAEGEKVADAWPNARLIAFSDLGHRKILWDPASVSAAVAFIEE